MTRAEHLFEILGELDEELVEEAAQPAAAVRRERHWGRWAALAACALLAAGLWNLSHLRMGNAGAAPADKAGGYSGSASGPEQGENAAAEPGGGPEGPLPDSAGAAKNDEISGDMQASAPEPTAIPDPWQSDGSAPGADGDAKQPPTNESEHNGPSACPTQPAASAAPQAPNGEAGGIEDMGLGGETRPAIPYREEDVLPEDAGSSPLLDELNRALEETIRTDGVPSELDVYKDGQSCGSAYPLISEEQARSLLPAGDRVQADGAQASDGELRYAATSRGFLLPCWRFTFPDGSTRIVPAVEASYLRTGDQ